jgi:hypothetical protein
MAITAPTTQAASASEKSVNFYQITRRNNPEDGQLHKYTLQGYSDKTEQ